MDLACTASALNTELYNPPALKTLYWQSVDFYLCTLAYKCISTHMEACSITSRASLESSTRSFVLCLAVRLMSPCMGSGEQARTTYCSNKIYIGHSPKQHNTNCMRMVASFPGPAQLWGWYCKVKPCKLVLCTCSLVTELLPTFWLHNVRQPINWWEWD